MAQKKKNSKESRILYIIFLLIACFIYVRFFDEDEVNHIDSTYSSYGEVEEFVSLSGDDLKVYFFDVGQADCILVLNEEESMLIDAGNNKDGKLIVDELKRMGIRKIDYLVGTHPHEDHIGGLDNVIDAFEIGTIYMPKRQADSKTFEDVLNSVAQKKMKVVTPKVGDTFSVGKAECEVLSVESDAADTNNSSIVIELTYGGKKFLFTGDAENVIEASRTWDDVDVLKVGHHGSRYSSTKNFLAETKPEIAVISVGAGNDYNHPHTEAIKRLNAISATIYRTDERGTIILTCDGNEIAVEFAEVCLDGN